MTLSRQLADLTSGGAATLATLDDIGDINLTGLEDGKSIYRDGDANLWKAAWASPKDATADLRDFMDARYGAGVWTGRTGVGTGTDIGPAIQDAGEALKTRYGRGTILIPPKLWLMTTPPSAASISGNVIKGTASSIGSQIVFNNASGNMFHFSGAGGYTSGGLKNLSLLIESGLGDTNSTAVFLQGDATYQPDQFEIEDIYCTTMSASTYWYNGLLLNGQTRVSPQGIRVTSISNYQQFQCRNFAIGLFGVVQCSMSNIGTYTGKGTGNSFYIGGGGTASTNSTQIDIRNLTCSGELNLVNATKVNISGQANTIAAGTSFDYYWLDIDHGGLSGSLGANGFTRFL